MKELEEKNEIAILEKQFATFFEHNPYSEIRKKGKLYRIINPWKDESISFVLRPEFESDLIAALNNLILPPRFTGIYHLDSNTMEFIYTLLDKDDAFCSREFEFTLDSKLYLCKFAEASQRLLLVGRLFRPTGVETATDYRNLVLLNLYADSQLRERPEFEADFLKEKRPISFFVRGFDKFDENEMVEVSKHLDFLMRYYDRDCPVITIHSAKREPAEPVKQVQFVETIFPERISTKRRDPFLLDLALAALDVETRLKYLYYYQILEHAAFYYTDDNIKRDLLRIINTPDILSNPDKYIHKILDTVGDSRQDDEVKIERIIKINCSPEIVWKELEQNKQYFSKRQEFEGGFVLEPFICEDMTFESFSAMWHPKTAVTIRHIRNALVPGCEKRVGLVIAPTLDNDRKISPWIPLIRRIAEQVIIFGGLT